MANEQMKPIATLLLVLNFCMYAIVLGNGGWAMNGAIDHGFIIGPKLKLPAHFSPLFFPMENASTGFFVTFALLAGVVGAASAISRISHIRSWTAESLPCFSCYHGLDSYTLGHGICLERDWASCKKCTFEDKNS